MPIVNETLIRNETVQRLSGAPDMQTRNVPVQHEQASKLLFDLLARLLGFGALAASLLFTVWGWLRLL